MERELALEIVRVTEMAALASSHWMGRGKKNEADGAATSAMRAMFDTINMRGTVVIGEGELDEAPMLYIGEKLGHPDAVGPEVDVAVDPLEGTTIVAKGHNNAMSVIAVGDRGTLLHAPDMYMMKMAVGKRAAGKINLFDPVDKMIEVVAKANNKRVQDVTVIIQERERHQDIIDTVREKARASSCSATAMSAQQLPPVCRIQGVTCFSESAAHRKASSARRRSNVSAATCRRCSSRKTTASGSAASRWGLPIRSSC